jgi:hypothetical protein
MEPPRGESDRQRVAAGPRVVARLSQNFGRVTMKTKCIVSLVALVVTVVVPVSRASADIVASYAYGDFDGSTTVDLPAVSIGQEGRVDFEFKADSLDAEQYLWYMDDSPAWGIQYRVAISGGKLMVSLWNSNGYVTTGNWYSPITAGELHSLSVAWKQGQPTLITLDGATSSITNAVSLLSSTSTIHKVGGANGVNFDGVIQNLRVRDTYTIPEPGTATLAAIGLIGLLAYAWKKRR